MQNPKRAQEAGMSKARSGIAANFLCARSVASTQENSEKPPFDRHARRAKDCIAQDANLAVLKAEGKSPRATKNTRVCN
jgi:hypothetical protein